MKRFLFNIVALSLALTLWSPQVASAQTGYTWTDISGQLSERTNRPIWAVARAGSSWFYTDGQDLWNGGQAYRYDGTTQVNITADIRNAGLTRIDDIVSDGTSVLFLKNVVRRDNSFEILKWNGSGFVGVGSYVRNSFASDEGISSLSGRNGTWYIVSTKGRVFNWNGDRTNPTQITLPSAVTSNFNVSDYDMAYQPGQVALNGIKMVPVGDNDWLLMTGGKLTWSYGGYGTAYKYNGSSFTDVTTQAFQMSHASNFLVSNGKTVLFLNGFCPATMRGCNGFSWHILSYDGNVFTKHTGFGGDYFTFKTATWNGQSWMLTTANKELMRVNPSTNSNVEDLGSIRDYLISAAGDTSGHFLVGGAQSDMGVNSPTNPLTAKLLWVTEGELSTNTAVTNGGSFGGDRVYTSANGPRVVIQGDPSGFRVGNGKEFTYRVTASDADGIDRTDLYVNDARIKTCYGDVCEYRTTYWTNGASTKTVKFWVRTTDKRGVTTDTSGTPDILTVDVNSTATAGGTVTTTPTTSNTNNTNTTSNSTAVTDPGTGISSWTWLDPTGKSNLNANENVTYNVGAYDNDGIKRIEIVVNGTVKKTCELNNAKGNQTCGVTLYANDYPVGTGIYMNAKVTDGANKFTYTTATTLTRNAEGTTTVNPTPTTANSNQVSTWTWFDPAGELKSGASSIFRAGAWAQDGLNSVELYVNGVNKRTCSFNRAYGNQECNVTIYGNDYAVGTQVSANAKSTDVNGKVSWSDLKTVTVPGATTISGYVTGKVRVTNNSSYEQLLPQTTRLQTADGRLYRINTSVMSHAHSTVEVDATSDQPGTQYLIGPGVRFTIPGLQATLQTLIYADSISSFVSNAQSANSNPVAWDWIEIAKDYITVDENTKYVVGAWDENGISSIVFYVNGNVKSTCNLGTAYGNQQCATDIRGFDYPVGSSLFVNAKVTDATGKETWTTGKTFRVMGTGTTTSTDYAKNGSVQAWTDRAVYSSTNMITVNGSASDEDGVNRIEILVNGELKKTCSVGNARSASCAVTVGPYPNLSSVKYAVTMFDRYGNMTTSGYLTVAIVK